MEISTTTLDSSSTVSNSVNINLSPKLLSVLDLDLPFGDIVDGVVVKLKQNSVFDPRK